MLNKLDALSFEKENLMFTHDRAIEKCSEDILGRKEYAKKLALAISGWKDSESLVVSLNGKWGSGKTSIINCVIDHIETNYEKKEQPTIIKFNSWDFSGQNKLTEHFFNMISKSLRLSKETKDIETANRMEEYKNQLTYSKTSKFIDQLKSNILLLFSLVGLTFSQVTQSSLKTLLFWFSIALIIVQTIGGWILNWKFFQSVKSITTIPKLKEIISANLISRKKKLLIIVDDIDRLSSTETQQLFRLIKSNADFPNTIYLLAYQQDIVEENINKHSEINGRDFLNKIVQIPFHIPKVKSEKILGFLTEELDKWIKDLPDSSDILYDRDHWIEIYHYGFKHFFNNLRDVKRFLNSYKFNLSIMINKDSFEINPTDLMALETIRLFCPDFFTFMRDNKFAFLGDSGLEYALLEEKNDKSRKEIIEKHISDEFGEYKELLTSLLTYMFPQLSSLLLNKHRAEDKDKWLYELRICHEACYDAYFSLYPGGDEDGITQLEVDNLIKSSLNITQFRDKIEGYVNNSKINTVIDRLRVNIRHNDIIEKNEELIYNISVVMFDISDRELDKPLESIFHDRKIYFSGIVYDLLSYFDNEQLKFELIKKVIKKTTSPFACINVVSAEEHRAVNYEKKHGVPTPIFSEEKREELKLLCMEKLQNNSIIDELEESNHYTYILYHWKKWCKTKDFDEYINKIINNNDKFIMCIKKFHSTSHYERGYDIVEEQKISIKDLESIISLEKVINRIDEIKLHDLELYNKENLKVIMYKINDYVAEKA